MNFNNLTCHWQRGFGFHGKGLKRVQIFQHIVDAASGAVVAGRELSHELLHDTIVGSAACQCLWNDRRVNAACFREFDCFRHGLKRYGTEKLVDEFGRLASSTGTHQCVVGAKMLHRGISVIEVFFFTARNDGQLASESAGCPTGKWTVNPFHSGFSGELLGHLRGF